MPAPLKSFVRTSSRATRVAPLGVVNVTIAPDSGTPSSPTTGSGRPNGGATMLTVPLRVRSRSTTCVEAVALRTPCTATRASVGGIATSWISQPASASSSATAPCDERSERNAYSDAGEDRELRDRPASRQLGRVLVEVDEDVLRVVGVDDADVGRDGGFAERELARGVEIEAVARWKTRRVAAAAERLDKDLRVAGPPLVARWVVGPARDLADDRRVRSARRVAKARTDSVFRETQRCHDIEVVPTVVAWRPAYAVA